MSIEKLSKVRKSKKIVIGVDEDTNEQVEVTVLEITLGQRKTYLDMLGSDDDPESQIRALAYLASVATVELINEPIDEIVNGITDNTLTTIAEAIADVSGLSTKKK